MIVTSTSCYKEQKANQINMKKIYHKSGRKSCRNIQFFFTSGYKNFDKNQNQTI